VMKAKMCAIVSTPLVITILAHGTPAPKGRTLWA